MFLRFSLLVFLTTVSPLLAVDLTLSGSVGKGGDNNAADVKKVQQRLNDLGFDWVTPDGINGPITEHAIRLFQAIKNGDQAVKLTHNDSLVDVGGDTHLWLKSANAPKWGKMSASGTGFTNIEIADPTDDHDWGTNWLDETVKAAANAYQTDYRAANMSSLITVNDASRNKGVDTADHKGHETGLSVDLRLPKKGVSGLSPPLSIPSPDFDRAAARAILKAFRAQPLINKDHIFFNDQTLIDEGLCKKLVGHNNHIHIEIDPPARTP